MNINFEYKLCPTNSQETTLNGWLETCRNVWNYALAERKHWSNSRKCQVNACSLHSEYIIPADAPYPSYFKQSKALTVAKSAYPGLKAVNAQAIQQVLRQLDKAFTSMKEQGHGFPRFKKKFRSICFPQFSVNPMRGASLKLPGLGYVKLRLSRPIPDGFSVKQVRVISRASGWYAVVCLHSDVELPTANPTPNAIGLDVGLNHFVALSSGELVDRPRFFVDAQRKLRLLQQRASRKVRGSNNRAKALRKVALLHEHIANTRKNFHQELAHKLCDKATTIFAEALNLKGLAAGMLGKHCLDAGWGAFLQTLEWVCRKRGVYFAKVNARGTSQTCPRCDAIAKKTLGERVHSCACGLVINRDVAAALMVLKRGLIAVGHPVMLVEGKVTRLPVKQESPIGECQSFDVELISVQTPVLPSSPNNFPCRLRP